MSFKMVLKLVSSVRQLEDRTSRNSLSIKLL